MTTARRHGPAGTTPARRPPGRPPVPLGRIVATALRIVDEDGVEALSMRVLARRLDSSTATLYRHFADRADLIAHVVDRMFGEVEFDAGKLAAIGWRRACQALAHTMFDTLSRHKNVAPLLVGQEPVGPNAMAQRERCLAVLLDNGFGSRLAALAYATLARYVLGFAIQRGGHGTEGRHDDTRLAARVRVLDRSAFPATVTVADSLPVPLEDEFAFGLELILAGLERLRDGEPCPERCSRVVSGDHTA